MSEDAAVLGIDRLVPFSVPMRVRFRGTSERSGVLLHGPAGWGEFSPFPEYGPSYASHWLAAAREAALIAFPAAVRTHVPVNTTIPAVDPVTAHRMARESGCRTAKVKVGESGQDLAADVERVAAVRDALGEDGIIRIDANGAWDVETAVLAITRLDRYRLEYVEQPCATMAELREVRGRVTVPIAADESIRTASDPLKAASTAAVDILVLKAQPLGGVRRACEIAAAAALPVVVSSALETSIGLAAGVAFAAALPELAHACGLGTATLLAGDLVAPPLVPVDGQIAVPGRLQPDPALLAQHDPAPEVSTDLLNRLAAADAVRAA